MSLTSRQKEVLRAVIQEYARKGKPVASKDLIKRRRFDFSPATIRAEMAYLEKVKLLEKPHTSAGRVPTDKGYRFYVNELMETRVPRKKDREALQKLLSKTATQEELLFLLTRALSQFTKNLALASLLPQRHLFFSGLERLLATEEKDFVLEATRFLETLEQDIDHFLGTLPEEGTRVFIGREHPLLKQKECGLILSRCCLKKDQGFLALLGPSRMDYSYNLSLLEYVTQLLEKT